MLHGLRLFGGVQPPFGAGEQIQRPPVWQALQCGGKCLCARLQRKQPAHGQWLLRLRLRHCGWRLQKRLQRQHGPHPRHGRAARLLAGRDGYRLPMRHTLGRPLAAQAQHAAPREQGLDAGRAQFSRFFHQPIHALVGRHATGNMHCRLRLTGRAMPITDAGTNFRAPHAGNGGLEPACGPGRLRCRARCLIGGGKSRVCV